MLGAYRADGGNNTANDATKINKKTVKIEILAKFLALLKPKTSTIISLIENIQGIKNMPIAPVKLKPNILNKGKVLEPINSAVIMQNT